MRARGPARTAAALAAVALVASAALGQAPECQPQLGQAGKDVIWVPTAEPLIERMLTMAQVGPGDVLFDLGSGDGRTVIAAAKRGAEAVGVEYDPDLVALSRRAAERERLSRDQARFVNRWRLLKAHQLARYSAGSIEQIASQVGFSSAQTLTRAFKRAFGYTPSGLRRAS